MDTRTTPPTPICEVSWSGRVAYDDAVRLMEDRVRERRAGEVPDALYLVEHPPVITFGTRGDLGNVIADREALSRRGVTVHASTRGGDVTYHGPGQLVGYPIVDLRAAGHGARAHVEALEEALIRTLSGFAIEAHRSPERTGVWVGNQKIAAIGVRIEHGITSHGFALNVATDLNHFDLIVPCGLPDAGVTSMRRLLDRDINLEDVIAPLVDTFGETYGRRMTWMVATAPDAS